MAHGHYKGLKVDDPSIREMFTRDYLLQSDWYRERLIIKQTRDKQLWQQHRSYLADQLEMLDEDEFDRRHHLTERISEADRMIGVVSSHSYLQHLQGTLGADWIHRS